MDSSIETASKKPLSPKPVFIISHVPPASQRSFKYQFAPIFRTRVYGAYNRKERSLGELCRRFLRLYRGEKSCLISLDACTRLLAVERRRLYDIINILESFSAVARKAKNLYEWRGLESIGQFIYHLEVLPRVSNQFLPNVVQQNQDSESSISEVSFKLSLPATVKTKRKKSLGRLCLEFMGLFIRRQPVVSLEQAAEMLSLSRDSEKIKTKVRRLYDIANVLQTLRLIEKTLLPTRKPAFKWLGSQGFYAHFEAERAAARCDLKEERTQKVFIALQEPLQETPTAVERINGPKYFKPKVLQLNSFSPATHGKRMQPELNCDETIEIFNKYQGAFTKLKGIPKVSRKVEEKILAKSIRSQVDSQIINIVY